MKKIAPGLLLIVLLLLIVQGCKKNPPPPNKNAKSISPATGEESLKPALDQLRQGTEAAQYRDALHLFNTHLSRDGDKQITSLGAEDKESLRKLYELNGEEWAEIDAGLFRPLDAFHLQNCYLFRDASRLLLIPKLPPLEQTRLCFAWVMRNVQLHEQADEGLPPAFVLRRGFGSGLDRALVFLALLRQFQIEGCLLAPTVEASGPILVGVLLEQDNKSITPSTPPLPEGNTEKTLFLFDPRLGQPILGADRTRIATLSDVRAHPDLLKTSALAAEQIAKLEVYQAVPMEALSARMRYLQDLLAYQDKVILYHDALGLNRDLTKAAGRKALVWQSPALLKGSSPTRALRLFLSQEEGGIDKLNRHQRFQNQLIPMPAVGLKFQEMHLAVPEPALNILGNFSAQLFTLFAVQPKEYFLHGQFEATLKRLDRIRTVLDTEEAAKPLTEAAFQKQLTDWAEHVREAYISLLVRKEAAGQTKVGALWNEDQYLLNVLQVDSEAPLEAYGKKTVSLILLRACREALSRQVSYLVASCLHEKAAQLQANLDFLAGAGKDVTLVKENTEFAWRNARGAWNKYLDRYALIPQNLPKRLLEIAQRWKLNDPETAVNLWELLHREMHTTFAARLRLADAQGYLQGSSPNLPELLADLEGFQNSDLPKTLTQYHENARALPPLARRLELLQRDWQTQGNIHWLRETARLGMEKGK